MDESNSIDPQPTRKLRKLTSKRMIDGVCSGIGEYFDVDPLVIRLALIAFMIFNFVAAIVFYITAMIIMPMKPSSLFEPSQNFSGSMPSGKKEFTRRSSDTGILIGVIVFIVGIILLFHRFDVSPLVSIPWFGFLDLRSIGRLMLPVLIILIGSFLLMGRESELFEEASEREPARAIKSSTENGEINERKRLYRSVHDQKIVGICGGLAEYLGVDSTFIRLSAVLLAMASFGMALILYLVFALVIPKEKI